MRQEEKHWVATSSPHHTEKRDHAQDKQVIDVHNVDTCPLHVCKQCGSQASKNKPLQALLMYYVMWITSGVSSCAVFWAWLWQPPLPVRPVPVRSKGQKAAKARRWKACRVVATRAVTALALRAYTWQRLGLVKLQSFRMPHWNSFWHQYKVTWFIR